MSAFTNSLDQWTFRGGAVAPEIHPVDSIYEAAARGDTEGFQPLVRIAHDTDELHRERGKLKPANDWYYQARYFGEAAP